MVKEWHLQKVVERNLSSISCHMRLTFIIMLNACHKLTAYSFRLRQLHHANYPYQRLFSTSSSNILSSDRVDQISPTTRLKIVVLHGKDGNGQIFKSKIQPLLDFTSSMPIDWIFPDAPHESNSASEGIHSNRKLAWWKLPEFSRSFNATTFHGVEESIDIIEKIYPFDILIGHSQGAMLTAIILARGLLGISSSCPLSAILSSAAWPAPFTSLLESVPHHSITSYPQLIHTICATDPINPADMAQKLANIFHHCPSKILYHPYGHVLPMDTQYLEIYRNLFCETLKRK